MTDAHRRLEAFYKITRLLSKQESTPQVVIQNALALIAEVTGARNGCVVTYHRDGSVANQFVMGEQGDLDGRIRLWGELIQRGLIGFVHHGRRPIIIRDIQNDPRWPRLSDTPEYLRVGSAIGLPMERAGVMYGVLAVIHPRLDAFDVETVSWLEAVVELVATTVGDTIILNAAPRDEHRYRWLFEDAVVPILITNMDGYIIDVNRKACEFLRYKRPELLQLPISAIHRMGTGPIGANRFSSLQEGNEVVFRSTAWTADGADLPVVVRARRLFFDDNDGIAWVEQDISTEMELEQLRQDLTSMVYHDLRGPLHTIYSSLTTLPRLLPKDSPKALADLLDVGIRSTKQLTRLVESLLDIQRLESGKAILDPKPTSMHGLLAEAAQLVQPLITESDQRLAFDLAQDLPFVTCDADMILRVVTNLMENAVKYTPMGGTITLSAVQDGTGVRIGVSDSGPGIPKHLQKTIFDKFSRVKYKDAPKGVGLGLAFCRLAVEAHGGQIWVESEPGQGSSFLFTLPPSRAAALTNGSGG